MPSLPAEQLDQRMTLRNSELLQPYLDNGQSVLILGIHHANWEWLLLQLSRSLPCIVDAVYKPLHNDAIEVFTLKARERFGAEMIPFKQASKTFCANDANSAPF